MLLLMQIKRPGIDIVLKSEAIQHNNNKRRVEKQKTKGLLLLSRRLAFYVAFYTALNELLNLGLGPNVYQFFGAYKNLFFIF